MINFKKNKAMRTCYTKEQRNEIYKKCLAYFDYRPNENNFLCHVLKYFSVDFKITDFPEIFKHSPCNLPDHINCLRLRRD